MNSMFRSLAALVLVGSSVAQAQNLKDGQCVCDPMPTSPPGVVRPSCLYQSHNYGDDQRSRLLAEARRRVNDFLANPLNGTSTPEPGMSTGTITWWFNSDADNKAMCERLKLVDVEAKPRRKPTVVMELSVHYFQKGSERDLGFNVGAYYGKRTLDPKPPKVEGGFNNGAFSITTGVGNPFASFLTQGIAATVKSDRAASGRTWRWECPVGDYCGPSNLRTIFFSSPSLSTLKEEQVGIKVSALPKLDPDDHTRVTFYDFSLTYSTEAGKANSLTESFHPFDGGVKDFRSGLLYVLGNETVSQDNHGTALLTLNGTKSYTWQLMLIRVFVVENPDEMDVRDQVGTEADDRTFTVSDLKALKEPEVHARSMREVLESIEPVCFRDVINPGSEEQICGFRFTKAAPDFIKQRLNFKVKGKLLDDRDKLKPWMVGDVFKGKGYYQMPRAADAHKPSKFKLEIELDPFTDSTRAVRSEENIRGMQLEYEYLPSRHEPLELRRSSIKVLSWNPVRGE